MDKLILPLMMYKEVGSVKKGTKRSQLVVPTWNHLYIRRGNSVILDDWVAKHVEIMANLTEQWIERSGWKKTEGRKVVVKCEIFWNDARQKDAHNIMKLHMDVFNDRIYDDDSNALLQIIDFDIDIENPRIEFSFEVGESFDRKARRKELLALQKSVKGKS